MARIGFWIASEDGEHLESEEYYFWLRDLIYSPSKVAEEVFIFGLADRCDTFKAYLGQMGENIDGIYFCTVPDNSKFEIEVKKIHWRIFRVFEIVRESHGSFLKLPSPNLKNAMLWLIAPFALVCLFVLKWILVSLITAFDNISLRSWPRRLVSEVNQLNLDLLIVPNIYLTEWFGVGCQVKLWDRRSSVSPAKLNANRIMTCLKKYSILLVGSDQVKTALVENLVNVNQIKVLPLSRSLEVNLKLEGDSKIIQNTLLAEYERNGNFYYPDLDLINIPYVVCPTEKINPEDAKNLIRAFEDIIRNKRINCKLIFTHELDEGSRDLVADLGMLFDVLWIKKVDPLALEIIIRRSKCLAILQRNFEDGLASWFKAFHFKIPTCLVSSDLLRQKNEYVLIKDIVFEVDTVNEISRVLQYVLLDGKAASIAQARFIEANYEASWEKYRLEILGKI
jgi:hypothetical protein